MSETEIRVIIEEVLAGKPSSYGKLIRMYQQPVYRLAFKMTGSREDAKDLTQIIFMKAYINLKTFATTRKFFSWIYRIALNETLNHLKSARQFVDLDDEEIIDHGSPEEVYATKERKVMVQRALLTLDPKHRSLVIMKYYDGLSYEEISEVTGLPMKKVKSRLFEARQNLKEYLTF
ncbi:MAG: RNA polymerase sigma factor [Bacteroidetes bacterium]|nr:RNA polymerase sigma factor [Bacteroidota bacterium]